MVCPSCGVDVESTHRFCHQCGASLAGLTPAAGLLPTIPINVVPLPGAVTAPEPVPAPGPPAGATPAADERSLMPTLAPMPVPTLAPPPTFQPVPGGAPRPAAGTTVPPPAAVPPQADDVPAAIGVDSKGDPVPPPPLAVGEPVTAAMTTTEPLPVVEQTVGDWTAPTAEQSAVSARSGSTAVLPVVEDDHRFRLTFLLVMSVLTAVVAVSAAILDTVSWLVTGTDSAAQTLVLDDLSSNHLIGVGIGVLLLLVGAVVGATGRRSGAGLAGGAALGLAGLLANAVGLGIDALDAVEVRYLATPGNTITSTREIGFFLAIGGAGLAGLSFVSSLVAARGGGRPRIVLTLLGIAATAAVVVGPLIPMGDATWLDNWSQEGVPDATMWLRLAVLVLVLVAGVTAFSIGGRFGGAMALGAVAIAAFQSVTAYLEVGDLPLGLANGNFFAADGGVEVEPHLVTLAGIMAVVLLGVLTVVLPTRRRSA